MHVYWCHIRYIRVAHVRTHTQFVVVYLFFFISVLLQLRRCGNPIRKDLLQKIKKNEAIRILWAKQSEREIDGNRLCDLQLGAAS